jgi:tyrosine-protein kinase Fer
VPYFTMTNAEASEKVAEGYRLPQPNECSQDIYKLMLKCWNMEPQERPNFQDILQKINEQCKVYTVEDPVLERNLEAVSEDLYNN